jgi:hypothetical protein
MAVALTKKEKKEFQEGKWMTVKCADAVRNILAKYPDNVGTNLGRIVNDNQFKNYWLQLDTEPFETQYVAFAERAIEGTRTKFPDINFPNSVQDLRYNLRLHNLTEQISVWDNYFKQRFSEFSSRQKGLAIYTILCDEIVFRGKCEVYIRENFAETFLREPGSTVLAIYEDNEVTGDITELLSKCYQEEVLRAQAAAEEIANTQNFLPPPVRTPTKEELKKEKEKKLAKEQKQRDTAKKRAQQKREEERKVAEKNFRDSAEKKKQKKIQKNARKIREQKEAAALAAAALAEAEEYDQKQDSKKRGRAELVAGGGSSGDEPKKPRTRSGSR